MANNNGMQVDCAQNKDFGAVSLTDLARSLHVDVVLSVVKVGLSGVQFSL